MLTENLTPTTLNRIQSQLGLSDNFTILSLDKIVTSTYDQAGYPVTKAICDIPEDWYLVTVEDKKQGFKNGFVRLQNLSLN